MKFKIYFEGITEIDEKEATEMWKTLDPEELAKGETEHIATEMEHLFTYIEEQKVRVEPIT